MAQNAPVNTEEKFTFDPINQDLNNIQLFFQLINLLLLQRDSF